ncbi:uncharacterized protein LOC128389000 [Panonychus citri]|uniref:uncharacterized protein LOC128389000 n=1 Tax=Panonychus citri TaxID=50023 RepID=UPI00230827B8|nr:uncharacterized protein LOC128389000 [Panonychus citri]
MLLVLSIYNLLFLWSSLVPSVDCSSNGQDEVDNRQKIHELITVYLEKHGIGRNTFVELNNCLDDLSKQLKQREDLVKQLKAKVDKIWVTNQAQTLKTKVFVNGNVRVLNRLTPKNVIITKAFVDEKRGDYDNLQRRLTQASRDVDRIAYQIDHQVVRKDKPQQRINGTIHFLSPITANRITIKTVKPSSVINGISLAELKTNVLRRVGNQTVTGHWKFTSTLFVDNLEVKGLLSGIDMSKILLTNSPIEQEITGRFKIGQATLRSLMFDSINGIDKNELVFRKNFLSTPITGSKRFTQVLSMNSVNLTGNLNGRDWNHLVARSININSPSPIMTSLTFSTVPTIKNLNARSVNNINISHLKSGLTPGELIKLSGSKTFRSLNAEKVILRGKLNGLSVPDDLVTLRSLQNLSAPITFDGRVRFISNLTIGTINGVDIVRDTVYRLSAQPQIVHGTKVFDNNVKVRNLKSRANKLRHINLDSLDPMASDGAQFSRRSNVIYKDSLTINGNLKVKTINGIQIDDLIARLFSRSRDQFVSWPTKFNGSLSVGSVTTNTVNGLQVEKDLVKINTNGAEQVITGRKVFNSLTLDTESELIMKGRFMNGIELKSIDTIKNDPTRRKDCYGRKVFSSVKVLGNIIAEKVNGLDLERDVMLTDRPQNITGKLTFTSNVNSYQISFPSGLKVNKINGQSIDEKLDHLVLRDSQSVTLENKDFHGGLVADEIDLLGTINGVDLNQLANHVVNLDSPQAIYSPLRFEDEVTFDNPINTRSINGFDLQNKFSSIIDSDNNRKITINGNLKINGNIITGRLNNQPTEELKNIIFQSNIDNRFNRKVIFNSSVTIDHLTLSPTATLDGIRPADLIPLDKPIQLDGPMRIRGSVHIDNQLIVRSGVINNCSLNEMTLLTEHRDPTKALLFNQPIDFNQLNILGNLRLIKSTINGVDVNQLSNQVRIVSSNHQSFNSSFTFANDVYVDELFISGPINGVDLQAIYSDCVRKSAGHQKITGHKVFKSLRINNGDVTFNGNVQLRGTINGINITQLNENLIKPGSFNTIHGVKIFTSNQPIVLNNIESSSLSGVDLSKLVLTSTSETLPEETIFTKPIEVDNLTVPSHHGRQLTNKQSSVQFMDPVNVQQLKVKRINGIPIENFVSTLRSTQLNGSYMLNKIYIHGDLIMDPNSTVNNVDLSEIKDRSVDLRSPKPIPGLIVFAGDANFEQGIKLTHDNVNGPGASVRLAKSLGNTSNWLEMDLKQLESELRNQTMLLARYSAKIDPGELKFHDFDVIDYFNDFDIDTDRVEKISISKHYCSVADKCKSNQQLTRTVYLQYANLSDNCQRKTSTFEIQGNSKQSLKDGLINADGKYFPLTTFSIGDDDSISVSAFTNLTDCEIDQENYVSTVTIDYLTNGSEISETYRFKELELFSDINYFLDNDEIILVTLRSIKGSQSMVKIYRCGQRALTGQKPCRLISRLNKPNSISMEMINSSKLNKKLLAIMTKPSDCSQNSTISIFEWINQNFTELGLVSTPNPLTMKFIEYPQSKQIDLIVGNNLETGVCAKSKSTENLSSMVNVYRVNFSQERQINLQQSMNLNVNSISSFIVSDQIYLVLSSKSADKTFIYQYDRKSDQFNQLNQHYITKGVDDVNCFWISPNQLFMIATTTDHHKAIIYQAYLTGFTN